MSSAAKSETKTVTPAVKPQTPAVTPKPPVRMWAAPAVPVPLAAGEKVRVVTVEIPMRRTGRPATSSAVHIDLRPVHAQAWRDLFDGLNANSAKLRDGKFVETPSRAIIWLLEQCILPVAEKR